MANIELTMQNLTKRGYLVSRFPNKSAAVAHLLARVGTQSVGLGGSVTLEQMGLYEALTARGETHAHAHQKNPDAKKRACASEVYCMSANGVSESGQIINIDGFGNRVAAMCYGPEKLFIVIGINKIAPNDEMALWRARNIASVKNCQRIGKKTPCATSETPKCFDCDSPERICRIFLTLECKPTGIPEVEVVIIDEALGY